MLSEQELEVQLPGIQMVGLHLIQDIILLVQNEIFNLFEVVLAVSSEDRCPVGRKINHECDRIIRVPPVYQSVRTWEYTTKHLHDRRY